MLSTRGMRRGVFALVVLGVLGGAPTPYAHAQDFELPPPPDELPPHRAAHFDVAIAFPVRRKPLCPSGAACIFGGGAGVGAALDWRWPRGFAAGIGYDLWFLDGNGVYEITSMQYLSARARYYGFQRNLFHPYIGASVGVVMLGDVFQRNAFGGGGEGTLGVELEITASLTFTASLTARFFAVGPFRSESDGVGRADTFGINAALAIGFGLVLVEGS